MPCQWLSFFQQWLPVEKQIRVSAQLYLLKPQRCVTSRKLCRTLESLMEILTAIAILPFLAALVVGAREAEQDRQ